MFDLDRIKFTVRHLLEMRNFHMNGFIRCQIKIKVFVCFAFLLIFLIIINLSKDLFMGLLL